MIAIDFDGVIVKRQGIPTEPQNGAWYDKPMPGAIETLRLFVDKGIEFYIHTNRPKSDFKKIIKWLNKWNFYEIPLITKEKQLDTTIYLDDRAVRFTNWNDFRKLIL